MPRSHHPQKKRRSKERQDRDARRHDRQEAQLTEGIYWQDRLSKRPLLRYRTSILEDDVIKLIQGMETENPSRRVTFHHPIEERTGIRYKFHIEYFGYPARGTVWIKRDQISGAVISGPSYTTIEFRSSFRGWEQSFSLLALGGMALAFLLWIAPMDVGVPCFNGVMISWLVVIGLYVVFLTYSERHPTHDQGMGAVLKILKAVKLEEPDEKSKHIAASKSKIEEV